MKTRLIAGLAALAAGTGGYAAWATTNEPTAQSHRMAAVPHALKGSSRELFHFDDLATMVATSPLVLDATVIRTETGAVSGSGEAQEGYTNAVLRINSVLSGTVPEATVTAEMLTRAAGKPIVLDGLEPFQTGDTGVFFLRPAIHPGNWVLTSSQGRYLADPTDKLKGAKQHDQLITRLSRTSRTELRSEIQAAKQAVKDGRVEALPLPPGAPGA